MVSILLNTLNRLELTRKCVGPNLVQTGTHDWELLVCDQGSTDGVQDYVETLRPQFYQRNSANRGIAPMLNLMLRHAKGDYFCIIDNDIQLPPGWLAALVDANKTIPRSGICGVHTYQLCPICPTCETVYAIKTYAGIQYRPGPDVFGTRFFSRKVLNKIGYICEDYGLYGTDDLDQNLRSTLAGFTNYYLGSSFNAQHLGLDVNENTPYRNMKWAELAKAGEVWMRNARWYREVDYYVDYEGV